MQKNTNSVVLVVCREMSDQCQGNIPTYSLFIKSHIKFFQFVSHAFYTINIENVCIIVVK